MKNHHIVQKGDTLVKIARQYRTTIADLCKLNKLPDPNKLAINQKIILRREGICGFEGLFLDANRNPIKNLEYALEFSAKTIKGHTGDDGKTKKILTDSPEDIVRVMVKRFDGSYKRIADVISGYANKLSILISPLVVVETELKPHRTMESGKYPKLKDQTKPKYGVHNPAQPTTGKKELGHKTLHSSTPDGKPLTVVEGDIPDLDDFLEKYTGAEVAQIDIEAAAMELQCEAGLIYAIAKQESSTSSFFKLGDRIVPKILYERHWFRKLTRPNKSSASPWESKYPDICGPAYHRAKKNIKGELIDQTTKMVIASTDDIYGPEGIFQYKRLIKAYQLDQLSALQSCSWGKFQIMGFNHKLAGFSDVKQFTKAMSRGDAEHIKAFLKFAKNNPILLNGLRQKNFERIAEGHNGSGWRALNPHYAANLKKYYSEYILN